VTTSNIQEIPNLKLLPTPITVGFEDFYDLYAEEI
jgi:hypothetical protein